MLFFQIVSPPDGHRYHMNGEAARTGSVEFNSAVGISLTHPGTLKGLELMVSLFLISLWS